MRSFLEAGHQIVAITVLYIQIFWRIFGKFPSSQQTPVENIRVLEIANWTSLKGFTEADTPIIGGCICHLQSKAALEIEMGGGNFQSNLRKIDLISSCEAAADWSFGCVDPVTPPVRKGKSYIAKLFNFVWSCYSINEELINVIWTGYSSWKDWSEGDIISWWSIIIESMSIASLHHEFLIAGDL